MRQVLIIGASLLLSEQFRERLRDHDVHLVRVEDRPADVPTRSLTDLMLANAVRVARPPAPPPWRNDQPWLTRKKKGRS